MPKRVSGLFLCFILLFAFSFPAYAANQVNTIDIQAVIYEDGSMGIVQNWEGSFEEKAGKCGINYSDSGYEICFGISRYGQNHYTIEYKLDNAVGGYSDRDGVNFRFVNDQMNTTPTHVTVQIRLADGTPITNEIADVWGFGFEGKVEFENGSIIARTDTPLSAENHMTLLFSLNKGILSPSRQQPASFEEMKQKAFEGSDYDGSEDTDVEVSVFAVIITILLTIVLPIGLVIWFSKIKKKKLSERFGYFRDLPNEGSLSATYALGRMFDVCEDGAILATGMLQLIQLGCLSPVETREVGFMGKTKEMVSLRLMGSHLDKMNEFDEYLYTVLESAAGSDAILQPKYGYRLLLSLFALQQYEKSGRAA